MKKISTVLAVLTVVVYSIIVPVKEASAFSLNQLLCSRETLSGVPNIFSISTTKDSAMVNFTTVPGASSYKIKYGLDPSASEFTDSFGDSGLLPISVRRISNLAPNTGYYFKIQAENGCSRGAYSKVLSATTAQSGSVPVSALVTSISNSLGTALKDDSSKKIQVTSSNQTPTQSCTYTVQLGDSLWSIAQEKLSDGSKFQLIADLNRLGDPIIFTDQVLNLPCDNEQATAQVAQAEKQIGYNLNVKVENQGAPVLGVEVTVHSGVKKAVTGQDGVAHFQDLEAGTHTVDLAYNGFTGVHRINLSGNQMNQTLTLQVNLISGIFSNLSLILLSFSTTAMILLIYQLLKHSKIRISF